MGVLLDGRILQDSQGLAAMGLSDRGVLQVAHTETMMITIDHLAGKPCHILCEPDETLQDLLSRYACANSVANCHLVKDGTSLNVYATLRECGIRGGCTVYDYFGWQNI